MMMEFFLFIYILSFLVINQTEACTEIIIRAADNSVVVGRSMDVDLQLSPGIYVEPKGTSHSASVPITCSKEGRLVWENRYHVIVIRPMKQEMNHVSLDGINDAGLTVSALYLPGYTSYEDVSDCSFAISQLELIAFVLGNFKSVSEVRKALQKNTFPLIWGDKLYGVEQPGHWDITDKSGEAIVLEYTTEGRMVYNNTVRVMTNSPTYNWHMENIKNHVHVSNQSHPERKYYDGRNTKHAIPKVRGSGLYGLPGDYTSPSRFIKAAMMVRYATVPSTHTDAVVQAFHILGSVEINKHVIQGRMGFQFYTFWQVAKDLRHNCIYYRSHRHISIRKICLPKDRPIKHAYYKLNDVFQNGVRDVSSRMKRSAE